MSKLPVIEVTFRFGNRNGYWDGGAKSGGVFEPKEESWCNGRKYYGKDKVKWGCWGLNFFFTSKRGKDWKDSARIAARHLRRILKVPASVCIA